MDYFANCLYDPNLVVKLEYLVFTGLKLPVTVCSNISKCSSFVGNESIILDISLSIQPLMELVDLHLLGLKPYE